ncbi:MAG: phosphoglucosamine mutase [Bacillus thermozeamaize]|uniref:Phosphoglucosamine mutase n=1 Tax=Bacillus thermozeamaize TaxID=230954 RepID=A0A1Y3PKS5_9BACI|nr:MAG: phosphoglucosamine mutase [Bacillus thermozeamaize]
MRKYFGTDGVRGVANRELTPELAFRIGRAEGNLAAARASGRPKVLIGRDTRISGEMLEAALTAGLLSAGADVYRLGIISTPGVAWLTKTLQADAGIMITASHNPVEDNGIKIFGPDGFKLTDEEEEQIERLLDEPEDKLPRPVGGGVGRLLDAAEKAEDYLNHLSGTIHGDLQGLKVVLDCAHGAASYLAPRLFRRLGAEVWVIGAEPDGININDGVGSTHPSRLQEEVKRQRADVGLAFDGDADRLIAVDEEGQIVDGDHIMCILARSLKEQGRLAKNTLVTTVMSNIGLYQAMRELGIATEQTAVGDRYVLERMLEGGFVIGGEQSGHVILLDYNTTGDGMLTALQLVQVIRESGKTLGQLKQVMRKFPQVLHNVRLKRAEAKTAWQQHPAIMEAIGELERRLGDAGRVLVRPSGTEPLLRIMAEGPDEAILRQHILRIAEIVDRELNQ